MTEQQKEILDDIALAAEQTPEQVKFKQDISEAELWLHGELQQGLIPSAFHNPMLLHHMDDRDFHTVAEVAKAMVLFEYEQEKAINECYD